MEWIIGLAALVGTGGGIVGLRRLTAGRRKAADDASAMIGIREMADEDTTLLGEQLARLGVEHPTHGMDEATRTDYQCALDAYESAKRAVPRLTAPEEVSTVVDTLSTGRYALACVEARLARRPVPELRVPCFFNPQHGPSTKDVQWTDARRGTRLVPACAQDASRVANGERPEIRKIRFGSTMMPYWDAGAAYLPYSKNYYSAALLQTGYNRSSDGGGIGGIGGN